MDLCNIHLSLLARLSFISVLIFLYVSYSVLTESKHTQFMTSEKAINDTSVRQTITDQLYSHKIVSEEIIDDQNGVKRGLNLYPVKIKPHLIKLINWTDPKYPMQVAYLKENKDLCASVKKLTVLVVVNSATHHFDRRQAIRKTWTNDTYYSHLGIIRVLFLVGMNVNHNIEEGIKKEFNEYQDILQGNFIDTYFNLTEKGVMGYRWLTERCRNAKLILKVDDDFLVNIFIYIRKLKEMSMQPNVYCDYSRTAVIRQKQSKWYLNDNHFRGIKLYERYCKGKFVSMTNDIIPSLYVSAIQTPFFPFDDVTLFGYVMHNVHGLKYKPLSTKDMENKNDRAMKCLYELKNKCSKFVISATGAKQIEDTWFTILKYFSKSTI